MEPITAILIGGCADGQTRKLPYPYPDLWEQKPLRLADRVKATPATEKPTLRKPQDEQYYHHPLNMADGPRIHLYIVRGMEPSEAIGRVLTAYTDRRA